VILRYGRDQVEARYLMDEVAAFVDANPLSMAGPVLLTHTFLLRGTDAERRMQADAIVVSMGATPGHKGRFYCASMPGTESLNIELLFVPPIPAAPGEGLVPDGIDR
jgi:hypothetical protein